MRRLLQSLLAQIDRSYTIQSFRKLYSWLTCARRWNWLFDRAAGWRPTHRVRLALEKLEERVTPSVTALDDSYWTNFAVPVSAGGSGVLHNDTGSSLTSSLVSQASHGTVSLNSDGSFGYTQTDFTFYGVDSFEYQATDSIDSDNGIATIDIAKAGTSTSLSASTSTGYRGQSISFTATITSPASSVAGQPTGSVVFKNGTTTLGTVTPSSGVAVFTTSDLSVDTHSITAEFTGSGVFANSASSAVSVTISVALSWTSDPPTFDWSQTVEPPEVTNPGAQSNDEGDEIEFSITAEDPNDFPLTYVAVNLPEGLSIDSESGVISGTIGYSNFEDFNGAFTSTVVVLNDHGGVTSVDFDWTITDTPRLPEITEPDDQTDSAGSEIELQIVASHPDDHPLYYEADGLP